MPKEKRLKERPIKPRSPHIPSPLSPPGNVDAAIYLAHLLVQAEAALPNAETPARIGAVWLATHIAEIGARRWRGRLTELSMDGVGIGSWTVRASVDPSAPDPISLPRRRWLAEEGEQLLHLSQPFRTGPVTPAPTTPIMGNHLPDGSASSFRSDEAGREALIHFAIAAVASHLYPNRRAEIKLVDRFGTSVRMRWHSYPSREEILRPWIATPRRISASLKHWLPLPSSKWPATLEAAGERDRGGQNEDSDKDPAPAEANQAYEFGLRPHAEFAPHSSS